MTTEPAVEGDTLEAKIESAPSPDEFTLRFTKRFTESESSEEDSVKLHEMQPSTEEMLENTEQATRWYNTAPYTAAELFVEAARSSEQFRRDFLERERFVLDEENTPTGNGWSSTLKQACPELHEQLNNLGLSAAQGGWGEQMARKVLEDDEFPTTRPMDGLKLYLDSANLANGDPVILLPYDDNGAGNPITLGTGFESYEDLAQQVEHAHSGGKTLHIPEERAEEIRRHERFHIFAVEGDIDLRDGDGTEVLEE